MMIERSADRPIGISGEALTEFERQQRVAYQMVSMHCEMRDLYSRRHSVLLISTMFVSVCASGFAFSQNDGFFMLASEQLRVSVILGISSIAVLFLTVLDLITNWSGKSKEHAVAATSLANLRSRQRELADYESPSLEDYRDLTRAYNQVVDTIVAIPQSHYQKLYARHGSMVAVTNILRGHPGLSVWRARWLVYRRAVDNAMKQTNSAPSAEPGHTRAVDQGVRENMIGPTS